jgi:hypothetical protein
MAVRICLLGLALLLAAAVTRAVVQAPAVAGEGNSTAGESHDSRLLSYQLTTGPGGTLANAWLLLRAEPQKFRPGPRVADPRGAQAASYPDSRWTVYTDIDGDSVFDSMVKVGPKETETYILYRNTWIEVGCSMATFTVGSVTRAKADGTDYVFKGHAWEIQKQAPQQ